MKRPVRALVTGAGSGSSGNLIRALQTVRPRPHIVGVNHDRFVLKMSLASCNYLSPNVDSEGFVDAILQIIKKERIDVVLPTDDNVVKSLSDARHRFPVELLLPRRRTIDLCQDKYALTEFLRHRRIAVPRTYPVRSLGDLDRIFDRFSQDGVLWCRARRGSRSVAATPVATVEQARSWITQWRDLRGVRVSDFTLAEYLPGRHYIVQSLWRGGRLLRAQSMEVLSYFAAGNNPSGMFSLSSLAKTVAAPTAIETSLAAVRALERKPSGTFFIELKENSDEAPCITEINAGRFPSGATALLAVGKGNMISMFASAAMGETVVVADPCAPGPERYLVRDIDAVPGVFSAADLSNGIRRSPHGLSNRLGHRGK